MSADLPHDPVETLLGAYALDAVDADEAAVIERHLEGCPRCRAELDAHREIAGAIGNSVEPLPPHLWDRIAREVDGPSGEVVSGEGRATGAGNPWLVGVPDPGRAGRWTTPGSPGRPWVAAPARIAAALLVAALVAVGALAASLSSAHGRIGALERDLAGGGDQAQIAAALRAPGHRTVVLRSPSGAALAELVVLASGRGYMVHRAMPALPRGQTYQLWAIIDGQAVSAGLLGSRPAEAAFTLASAAISSMAVTVEPAGGSVVPTGPKVAAGPVVRA